MNKSNVSGHWTEDELLAHIYGIGPDNQHLDQCAECRDRLSAMVANRNALEQSMPSDSVSFEVLAAQRRSIYAKLTQPAPSSLRRWASAATAVLILGGGLMVYQQEHRQIVDNKISDAQLAAEVSRVVVDAEPESTAPLQALFEE